MLFELGIGIKLVNKLTSPLRQVNRDLNKTTRAMHQLDTVTGKLSHGLSRLQRTIQRASLPYKQLREQANAIRNVSQGLVLRGTATAAISLVPTFSAMGFEKGLAEVATLTDMSVAQFRERYGNQILSLANELGEDQAKVVSAMYQAISAGIKPDEAIAFLRAAGKSAIAGVSDIFTSTDLLTTIKNSFHVPASEMGKVSDIIFQTVKEGKTTFREIADSFAEVGASASIAGVSLEQVQAAVARMTLTGVKTPAAYIKIKYALEALTAPTNQAKNTFKQLGLTINAETLKQHDLLGTMDMIAQKIEKLPFAKQAEAISSIFSSIEAQEFFKDFMSNRDKYKEMVREIKNSAGATEGAYKKMANTADREFKRLKQTFKSLTITVGVTLLPAFLKVLSLFAKVLSPIVKLTQRFPKLTAVIMGTVMAGGLLTAGLGVLGWTFSFVLQGIAAYKTALTLLAIFSKTRLLVSLRMLIGAVRAMNLAFLTSPVTLIIVAIAAAAFLIIKYWKPISKFFKGLWKGIVSAFKAAVNALSKPFKLFFDYSPIMMVIKLFKELAKLNLFDAGKKIILSLWSGIKAMAMKPVEAVRGVVQKIRNFSKPFKLVFDYSPIGIAIRLFRKLAKLNLFEAGKKIILSLWSGIKAMAMKPVEAVKEVVQKIGNFFKSLADKSLAGIVRTFKAAINALSKPFKLVFDYSPIGIAIRLFRKLAKLNLFDAGKKIISSLLNGIKAMAMKPVEAVKGVVQKIRNLLPFSPAKEGPLRDINRIKLIETIADNVKPEPLKKAMSKALNTIKNIPLPFPAFAGNYAGKSGGTVTINYSPNVHINGASQQAKDDFLAMLKRHRDELLKMIHDAQMKQARLAY